LAIPAAAVLALALTACVGLPLPVPGGGSPSPDVEFVDPQTIDPRAAEDLMREALPVAPADFDVYDGDGLGEETFASDWSVVNHDARRVARILRAIESPGWARLGCVPGYLFDVEGLR